MYLSKTALLIFCLLLSAGYSVLAQKLTGIVFDKPANTPIPGAIVILADKTDSTRQYTLTTDKDGQFAFSSLKSKSYKITVQNLGYSKYYRNVEIDNKDLNLGLIFLEPEARVLNEVVVKGQAPPVVQKGDTTEMNSSAYKTNPDANAEDLVKKMPGITVENGTVKAHGEEVKKILVDGKQFFGDDPSVALKNLPAEVIDKVQVYNKLSEQSELTGVDDGQSAKTINIITKQNRRSGQFGKVFSGTDFSNKYLLSGNLNVFKGNRRITVLGTMNNINQQNFSTQDMTGTSGGRMGGGGFSGGSQNGITKTKSLGVNFTDSWGKKINVNGSYFYSSTDNNLAQEINSENLFITEGKYSSTNSESRSRNYNQRGNLRIEYNIDSVNTILIIPRLTIQNSNSDKNSFYNISGGNVYSSTQNMSNSNGNSYNLANSIIYRHKFSKPRRTLSFNISSANSNRNFYNTQFAVIDTATDDQYSENVTKGLSLSANASYTEPITKYGMLMVSLNSSGSKNETDKETFRLGEGNQRLNRLDSLSNVFNNHYNTNRGGLSYVIKKGQLNLTFGVDYQQAILSGNQVYPQEGKINKTFENVLPKVMITYKMANKANLRIFFRSSTNAPSISQLQKVIDNSNRLSLSTGNPNLKQEYTQNLMSQYSYANSEKGFNSFVVLSGGYTRDNIGYRTIYAQRDSLYLPDYDVKLRPGAQLDIPVNLDRSFNIRTLINIGQYVKPLRSNISVLGGVNFSQTPGYIDSVLNRSNSYSFTNSLIIASNISEKIDFSVSYTSNYSIVKNTQNLQTLRNTEYWFQSANIKINWIFFKGFVLQSDLAGQFNQGLSGSYNQNYTVWNASFGKKFLKNNAAELKLSVFDILNQNKNINRTVTATTIQDSRTNTFPRYFLVVFTYNLRNFNGQKMPSQFPGRSPGRREMMPMGQPPAGVPSDTPAGVPMAPSPF